MPLDSDDLERRDLEREAQMERLEKLEAWHAEQPGIDRVMLRIAALEARFHELEHWRAAGVQSQIADLQERVGALENARSRERPVQVKCLLPCDDFMRCEHRSRHSWQSACGIPCSHHKTCRPVAAQEPEKPAPVQMVICSAPCVDRPKCMHLHPHVQSGLCLVSSCGYHVGARCAPVPASPEVAIPDVPTPVGTEAFRRVLAGHMQELSGGYCWSAERLAEGIPSDYLERLAGVACTLRDAYELARCGEQEQADEKLREIEW